MALLLVTYMLFPSWYRAISQRVFGMVYTQHAQSLQNNTQNTSNSTAQKNHRLVPMFVIARPPQTPYDYLIATIPEQQQVARYKKGIWYVYDETETPVGYIEKVYPTVCIVTLFSAPGGSEVFAVNNYVSHAEGDGGGSFSLQVPIDIAVPIGTPIIHQATGKIASTVIAIESMPEKNIQKVIGTLKSSPLEMATVYVTQESNDIMLSEPIESVIDAAKSTAIKAERTQRGGGELSENANTHKPTPE